MTSDATAAPAEPPVAWILSSRARRRDELAVRGTFRGFDVACEFARERVTRCRDYEAVVINSKGVEVYNTRKEGITKRPRRKA